MIVVADSGPLMYLAAIARFELLRELYGTVLVPKAVYTEVVDRGLGRPGEREVRTARRGG